MQQGHTKYCYMCCPSASTLANEADLRLFRAVTQDPNDVQCKLLPEAKLTRSQVGKL